jgi:hypothetical protein
LSIRNPLAVVVNALTMTLGNVNNAPLELNALAITDMRLTVPELRNRITYHYRQDVLRQLYRILGSADFIGNPVGLFTNVSSGVADIFYAPYNGIVMHGNKELGIGIAKVIVAITCRVQAFSLETRAQQVLSRRQCSVYRIVSPSSQAVWAKVRQVPTARDMLLTRERRFIGCDV